MYIKIKAENQSRQKRRGLSERDSRPIARELDSQLERAEKESAQNQVHEEEMKLMKEEGKLAKIFWQRQVGQVSLA